MTQIEASNGTLSDELRISARRMAKTGARRPARPLGLLIQRGLIIVVNKEDHARAVLTRQGIALVHRWFATKPPDFITRFPLLYRTLGLCEEISESTASAMHRRGFIGSRRKS